MIVQSNGISMDLPPGWEAEVDGGGGDPEPGAQALETPRVHIANFPLPAVRGDFGSGAVERMIDGDAIICLLEESGDAVGTAVYAHEGIPRLTAADFAPNRMQRPLKGQAGTQKFFSVGDRAFVLYVAIGAHTSRGSLVHDVNGVLDGITID